MAAYDLNTQNTKKTNTADAFATAVPVGISFGAFNVGKGSAKGGSSADARGSAAATAGVVGEIPQWVWIAGAVVAALYFFKGGKRHG